MTLKQAQALYEDAIEMKFEHKPNTFSDKSLTKLIQKQYNEGKVKILFVKAGKMKSRIILSEKGYTEVIEPN